MVEIRHKVTGDVIFDTEGTPLRGADLTGADLRWACLTDADLTDADLREANLADADLREANLNEARVSAATQGLVAFGPVGSAARTGYVHYNRGDPLVILGCHTDTLRETVTAIRDKYGADSEYEKDVRAAVVRVLEENEK